MMRTALSIAQSVKRRMGQAAPTALYGATDPDELQIIELLYATCEELRQARCWTQQKRSHSFATVASRRQYPLPRDFYSTPLSTHWNQSENEMLVGPVGDGYFNMLLYGEVPSSTNYTYKIFGPDTNPYSEGGQFYVDPLPASAQTLSFDYISRNLFVPKLWLASTPYTTADKVFVNGNIYQCVTNGTSSAADPPSGLGTAIADGTAVWDYYPDPYETILADTDLCIFDYDLVALGLRAKLREEHDGEADKAEAEFRSKIDQAVARYKGLYIGSFGGRVKGPRYSVPYRNWSI